MTNIYNKAGFKDRRRELRQGMPLSERALWSRLRNRQLEGLKFRRQYGIGVYVVDICCPEVKLVVEVDGYSHTFEETWTRDEERRRYFEALGFAVVRVTSDDVHGELDAVMERIASMARLRAEDGGTSPQPSP
jgi:very-short-patch-repair endonuclease